MASYRGMVTTIRTSELDAMRAEIDALRTEVERLGEIVTECDGVECVKHDAIVRGAMKERDEAEARAEAAEKAMLELTAETHRRLAKSDAESSRLRAALEAVEIAMDTAAMHGLPQQLPPAYRDSWAAAHTQARQALKPPDCQRQLALGDAPAEEQESAADQPYLIETRTEQIRKYNPNYGDDRLCNCEHVYGRHFDGYDDMVAVGCKYCDCFDFVERAAVQENE